MLFQAEGRKPDTVATPALTRAAVRGWGALKAEGLCFLTCKMGMVIIMITVFTLKACRDIN